jgi:hypothetical protein
MQSLINALALLILLSLGVVWAPEHDRRSERAHVLENAVAVSMPDEPLASPCRDPDAGLYVFPSPEHGAPAVIRTDCVLESPARDIPQRL